jgi:hypothetical protein
MDIKMNPDINMKTELTKAISGIEDLFSVEVNISKEPSDLRSLVEAHAFLRPNFEHKDMGEEIKSVFDKWYENGYLTLCLTMHNGLTGMSLFIRGVRFHIDQSVKKKDAHGENGDVLSKDLRAFVRSIIREWKKEAERRNDAKGRSWATETIRDAMSAYPAERKRIEEFGENISANMSSSHISKISVDVKKSKDIDQVNLDLSLSLKNIDNDKLKAIMALIQQI